MENTLNTDLLASMIKQKRGKQGLRATANEIGDVSAATLSRIEQGKVPDVDTFIKICQWLNVPTDAFIIKEDSTINSESEISHQDEILFHLRADKELDKDTVEALIQMVRVAYSKKI
jgi:transcriptional regulator with XRE-family HTH domain